MKEHNHPMDKESIRACALAFGPCWQQPPQTHKSAKHGYSNKPHQSTLTKDNYFK